MTTALKTWVRWSPGRDALLRESYLAGGLGAAAAALGVTRSAVKNRVHQLGLRRPARVWTPAEDDALRAGVAAGESIAVAAARLGRGVPAAYRRAAKIGLVSGRRWLPAEVEAVRTRYYTAGCAALAAELLGADTPPNRHAVYALASRLGVAGPVRHPRAVYDRVRELHGRGLNDAAIAREMRDYFPGRNDRERVTAVRRRLGLPAIRQTPAQRVEMGRKGRLLQGRDPRSAAYARLAGSYGLPPDTPPQAVRIVLALASGPMTLTELEAAGCHPRLTWNAIPTTYVAGLVRRGLVVAVRLATHTGDRFRYMLTAAALDMLAAAGKGADRAAD